MNHSAPFIVGCARSGTTLLRAMLDSHPDLWMANEPRFIAPIVERRRRYRRGHHFRADRLVDDLVGSQSFSRMGMSEQQVRAMLVDRRHPRLEDALRAFFSAGANRAGKRSWGVKNPDDVLNIQRLAAAFAEARFIHIIRDGRDVALSLRQLRKGPRGIADAGLYWRRRVESGRRAARALPPERYMEVRYEDLVADPQRCLDTVCGFIEIPFHPAMLAYHRRSAEVLAGNTHPELHRRLRLPPTAGTRDWRKEMAAADVATFESVAGRTLVALGYELSGHTLSMHKRLAAVRNVARHRWRTARRDALDRLKAMAPAR